MLILNLSLNSVNWIILFLHILLCLMYSCNILWSNGRWQEALFIFVICLLIPIFGFIIIWTIDFINKRNQDKSYEDLFAGESFFQDELKILTPLDLEKERDRVPLEEVLLLNNNSMRRKSIINTLAENNIEDYLDILKEALNNDDGETSHYASSIITQVQTKLQNQIREEEKNYQNNPNDMVIASVYETNLYELLNSGILDLGNSKRYLAQYNEVSDMLLESSHPSEDIFQHRIEVLFSSNDYSSLRLLIDRYLEAYPASENAVMAKMRLYIETRDGDGMKPLLDTLSERPLILSPKSLKYIRFFMNL